MVAVTQIPFNGSETILFMVHHQKQLWVSIFHRSMRIMNTMCRSLEWSAAHQWICTNFPWFRGIFKLPSSSGLTNVYLLDYLHDRGNPILGQSCKTMNIWKHQNESDGRFNKRECGRIIVGRCQQALQTIYMSKFYIKIINTTSTMKGKETSKAKRRLDEVTNPTMLKMG